MLGPRFDILAPSMISLRTAVILPIFLFFYLPLQLYLLSRVKSCINLWARNRGRQRVLLALATCFVALMLLPLAWRVFFGWRSHEIYFWLPQWLFAASAIWGVGSTLSALALVGLDLFQKIAGHFTPQPVSQPDPGRREFLKKSVGMVAAAPFIVSGYGVFRGRHRFQVEHFDIPVDGLSSHLSQLSIVHLSDIHVGPFMPPEELSAYVEAVNRLRPDLIALTGDFVATSPTEAAPCAETLGHLRARYGIFACMGNHDVYAGVVEDLTRLFDENGVRALRNSGMSLEMGNSKLNILGIDDLRWGPPDLARANKIARQDPGEVKILLSHRPEVFPTAARMGLDVVLSGHYHGGQVKLGPDQESLSVARFLTPYAEGLFRSPRRGVGSEGRGKGSALFVSRGIGVTALPIRVNCPPQIAHLRLIKA